MNDGFPDLGFQGKISVYCVFSLSFTFLIKSFFTSSTRFSVEVFLISYQFQGFHFGVYGGIHFDIDGGNIGTEFPYVLLCLR
jgi:hypothetical protein